MSRLYNREALIVVFGGLALILLVVWLGVFGRHGLVLVAAWLVASLPVAMKVQHALVPVYCKLGLHERAIALAADIRDSAARRKERDRAAADLAMVQAAAGRFEDAVRNLEGIKLETFPPLPRALILANLAWARVHAGKDPGRALEDARAARDLAPEQGFLSYFEGLALLRLERPAEAVPLIAASLEADDAPDLPSPGERVFFLGEALAAEKQESAAIEKWEEAGRLARGKGPFAPSIDRRLRAVGG